MLNRLYEKLGPLGPSFLIFTACLFLFSLNRMALGFFYSDSLIKTEHYLYFIPVGIRTDVIILCLFFFIPVLLTLLSPTNFFKQATPFIVYYFTLLCTFFIFMEIASWPFLDQYSSRPNQLFFQYLSHPKEVFLMIWADYKSLLIVTSIFLVYFMKFFSRIINYLFSNAESWTYPKKLVALPILLLLLTLGARSGIGQANANPGIAAFSNNHLANQIALNASYSLTYALYLSRRSVLKAESIYGKMTEEEVIRRIKKYMDVPEEKFTSLDIPTLHIQEPTITRDKPLNLVIILMEGFGSNNIDALERKADKALTPNFNKLSKEGVLFTNIHSIGTRTSRGIEAMVSGYLPTSKSSSILKMGLAQHNFFTVASLLKQHNYDTSFIYNGEAHFDNMAAFFLGNGFDHITDEADFVNPDYYGTWGVSDEDLFTKANAQFREKSLNKKENFLSIVLTISNHPPFDFPKGKITLHEQPANTSKNSTKYADYALGKFFEMAKKEDYYKDTVFLITADHPLLIRANSLVPVNKYKIPGLIIAPGLKPQRIDTLGSQIDLLPTAIGLLGMKTEHPMIGRNLLKESPQITNKQVSIYLHSIAFRTKEKMAIYQAHKKAKTFSINSNGKFTQVPSDIELEKDALAHILFPGLAYRKQIYRLK